MKKIILLIFLLCAFAVDARLIDETGISNNELNMTIQKSDLDILLLIKKTSTDLYNISDDIFSRENPYLMISYQEDNKKMYLLRSKSISYDDESLAEIIKDYKARKKSISGNEELNAFFIDFINDLNTLRQEDAQNIKSKDYCQNIKDGICDNSCPVVDIDCYCPDDICQSFEKENTCQKDCVMPKKAICTFLSDGVCQSECFMDIDCSVEKYTSLLGNYQKQNVKRQSTVVFILIGLLLALTIIFAIILIKFMIKNEIFKK